ncbi:hypothetical protein [Candidatus Hodgkinia cicadicola]|uniref:hypothetical protein n=1 Tax=Candidatus Hodgkinia cicadicola TaxID=573658 RepID=UPI0011BABCA6
MDVGGRWFRSLTGCWFEQALGPNPSSDHHLCVWGGWSSGFGLQVSEDETLATLWSWACCGNRHEDVGFGPWRGAWMFPMETVSLYRPEYVNVCIRLLIGWRTPARWYASDVMGVGSHWLAGVEVMGDWLGGQSGWNRHRPRGHWVNYLGVGRMGVFGLWRLGMALGSRNGSLGWMETFGLRYVDVGIG